jgi:hypothetical protein
MCPFASYLLGVIAKLKARGIKALVDVHALPGGSSSCQVRHSQTHSSCCLLCIYVVCFIPPSLKLLSRATRGGKLTSRFSGQVRRLPPTQRPLALRAVVRGRIIRLGGLRSPGCRWEDSSLSELGAPLQSSGNVGNNPFLDLLCCRWAKK